VGTNEARKREVMWTQDGPNAAGRAISGPSDEGGAARGCAAELLRSRTHLATSASFLFLENLSKQISNQNTCDASHRSRGAQEFK